jgi:hypothetical protein
LAHVHDLPVFPASLLLTVTLIPYTGDVFFYGLPATLRALREDQYACSHIAALLPPVPSSSFLKPGHLSFCFGTNNLSLKILSACKPVGSR